MNRDTLVAQYKDGYRILMEALEGATDAELDARPAPGKWSAREIVHHLADSELIAAVRLRRLIAEPEPLIPGYDQDEYARRLHYDRPIATSLLAFRFARESTAELLDRLDEAQWARQGTHSEKNAYGVMIWLQIMAEHAPKHAIQIRHARASAAVAR
jgi:hypothetical protein